MAGDTRFWINPETGWRLSASPASIPAIIMVITVNMCVCLLPPGLLRFYLKVMRAWKSRALQCLFVQGGTVFVSVCFCVAAVFCVFIFVFVLAFLPGLPLFFFRFLFVLRRKVWAIRRPSSRKLLNSCLYDTPRLCMYPCWLFMWPSSWRRFTNTPPEAPVTAYAVFYFHVAHLGWTLWSNRYSHHLMRR